MVKFSKQLEVQLVPEWKGAFCNYAQLKKDLKQIRLQRRRSVNSPRPSISSISLSTLTRRRTAHENVILVHQRRSGSSQQDDLYETELLEPMAQADLEKDFFVRLDAQLNKVNQFYRRKEEEFLERGEEIKKQLEKLIVMQKALEDQKYSADMSEVPSQEQSNETGGVSSSLNGGQGMVEINMFSPEGEIGSAMEQGDSSNSGRASMSPNSVQHNMKLNIPKTTPVLAISALTQMLWDDVLNQTKNGASPWRQSGNMTRKKMQYAEKMLRTAFVEFYRGLGLLRSFSSLNMVAFAKILKKYDKVTGRHASLTYLKVVERAYFYGSDKVVKMMDEVEKLFTEHFTKADHKKAMTFLRPMQNKASHTVTFFLGLFTGCSFAFFAAFIILLHLNGSSKTSEGSEDSEARRNLTMESIYSVFSMLALIVLHFYMYGWNLFMWRLKRINYAFIFEFATNKEVKYREVLLVSTGLTAMVTGGMLVHFAANTTTSVSFNIDIIPLLVVLVFSLLLFCPLNICYRSSRFFFLRSMKHIILAPLYKVVMADFFLADQLTSQVPMLRNAEYVMCYYFGGHFRSHNTDACTSDHLQYAALAYFFSFLPYWWRLMQCLRRWIDERDRAHLANGAKYFSAMVAAGTSLTYKNTRTVGWLVMFIISSTLATVYQLYWDFVVDWGLLQPNSRNPWLRDQLVLKKKYVYFISMVLDFFLRFAWLQSVTHLKFGTLDSRVTDLFFASLEVVRRGHWNFYRLENEHLNNVGKFRAVKTVPLPFQDVENDT